MHTFSQQKKASPEEKNPSPSNGFKKIRAFTKSSVHPKEVSVHP